MHMSTCEIIQLTTFTADFNIAHFLCTIAVLYTSMPVAGIGAFMTAVWSIVSDKARNANPSS